MVAVLARFEHDLHGYALYYFDVVARGIFRRQKAESGTRRRGDAVHVSPVLPAASISVDFHVDPLTNPHLLELRLFEIGRHPNVIQRDQRHDLLTGC